MMITGTHSAREDIGREESSIRVKLETVGIKVRNCERVAHPTYRDNYAVNSSTSAISDLDMGLKYSLHWTLEMSDRQVSDMMEMGRKAEYFHEKMYSAETAWHSARKELMVVNNKIAGLKTVLSETPGLKEQWDELMVMCKLAGLDKDIIE